jgi:glycosyltransferase involved in cell wall biosynthesis
MILFDALHVNRSGGEILLDVLIEALTPYKASIHFLIDDRLTGKYDHLGTERVTYLKASIPARNIYYLKNRHRFSKVFCFSGLPPTVSVPCEVIAYLQNTLLIKHPGWKQPTALKRGLQNLYMRLFGQNVTQWVVQTEHMRTIAAEFFNHPSSNVAVFPFFRHPLPLPPREPHKGVHFIYTSDGYAHKNHLRLFDAFESLSATHADAFLHVTVGSRFTELKHRIDSMAQRGVRIFDHGFLSYHDLIALYASMDCQVFPSLTESLGIGLIESAQAGLPVIASNMDFVHEVIRPTLTFDPLDVMSIHRAMESVLLETPEPASLTVRSEIDALVRHLLN